MREAIREWEIEIKNKHNSSDDFIIPSCFFAAAAATATLPHHYKWRALEVKISRRAMLCRWETAGSRHRIYFTALLR